MTEDGKLPPQEDAAYEYVTSMVARADADNLGAPLWHGWALRYAFLAGCKFQQGELAKVIEAQPVESFCTVQHQQQTRAQRAVYAAAVRAGRVLDYREAIAAIQALPAQEVKAAEVVRPFKQMAPGHVADPRGPDSTRIAQHDALVHPKGISTARERRKADMKMARIREKSGTKSRRLQPVYFVEGRPELFPRVEGRNRLFLADGTEIPHVISFEARVDANRLTRVWVEFEVSEFRIATKRPQRKA